MFILKSLHLKNFGAVSDSVFTPLEDGVTSIHGANGNGKSTFLDAMVWALFGSAPREKKQIDIRNFHADDKEKTFVEVVFEHEGDLISVTRSMNKRGTVTAEVLLNGNEVTKITPTTAVAWVKRRLGISEESFTQAFAIRQKELDDLVSAKPARRREIIERIFGVDKLSLALKYAKEAEKESRISFEQYRDVSGDIAEATEKVETLTEEFQEIEKNLEELSVEADDLETAQAEARNLWDTLSRDERAYRNAYKHIEEKQNTVEQIKHSISYQEKSLAELNIDETQDIEAEFRALDEEQNSLRLKIQKVSDSMEENTRLAAQKENEKKNLSNSVRQNTKKREDLADLVSRATAFLEQDAPYDDAELLEQVKAVDVERESLMSVRSVLENTISTMAESLTMLDGHGASCPTCQQKLEDPQSLIASFKKNKEDAETQLQDNATQLQELKNKRTLLENNKRELDSFIESSKRAQEEKDKAEAEIVSLDKMIAEDEKTLKTLEADGVEDLNVPLRAEQAALTEQREKVLKKYNNVENLKRAIDKAVSLKNEIADNRKRMESISAEIEDLRGEMPVAISSDEVEKAQKSYIDVEAKYKEAKVAEQTGQQSYYSKKSALELLLSDVKNLEAEDAKRTAMKKAYEQRVATSKFIGDFRKETISRIAPEISASASAVVSSMTSDEFVGINIDEEFTPSVIRSDGREDPVSFLSGGEKSLVALSMFLGIRDILSGGVGGFMWADEALVSQDSGRRNLIATTLRNLPHAQLVMVNHTPDGNDLSDVVVELVKGEKGSYLKYD